MRQSQPKTLNAIAKDLHRQLTEKKHYVRQLDAVLVSLGAPQREITAKTRKRMSRGQRRRWRNLQAA